MADFGCERANRFEGMGFAPELPWSVRKIVSTKEKGVVYRVQTDGNVSSAIFKVDGQIITEGLRCDKFVVVKNDQKSVAIFLELKGGGINHAIEQLESTIKHLIFKPYPSKTDNVRAIIVTSGGPASRQRIELNKAKERFLRLYNIELRLLAAGSEDRKI